ncbi:hypothetical protein K488DRAFT_74472 [Vararia minispora EC-137]|uniref:Uncharacterized protein n=1 Tax=Vararia minispora EC-137 TaxID=1314806 RepID=A0ACB8Q7E5_9AGAM|nr:hypothetical protein K488DRAFT_74472 [Vararia minispora EC-137]
MTMCCSLSEGEDPYGLTCDVDASLIRSGGMREDLSNPTFSGFGRSTCEESRPRFNDRRRYVTSAIKSRHIDSSYENKYPSIRITRLRHANVPACISPAVKRSPPQACLRHLKPLLPGGYRFGKNKSLSRATAELLSVPESMSYLCKSQQIPSFHGSNTPFPKKEDCLSRHVTAGPPRVYVAIVEFRPRANSPTAPHVHGYLVERGGGGDPEYLASEIIGARFRQLYSSNRFQLPHITAGI